MDGLDLKLQDLFFTVTNTLRPFAANENKTKEKRYKILVVFYGNLCNLYP